MTTTTIVRLSAFSTAQCICIIDHVSLYNLLYSMSHINVIYLSPCRRVIYKAYDIKNKILMNRLWLLCLIFFVLLLR